MDNFLDLASLPEAMASKNLFSGVASEGGGSEPAPGATTTGFGAVQEREVTSVTWGPSGMYGLDKLPYDYAAAVADREVRFKVTANRVMPLDEANRRLVQLMRTCGVASQADNVQLAFHRALLLAHALNSASVVQPDRAVFQVEGGAPINFYHDIVAHLGDDTRRFFRAYADMTREVVRSIYQRYRDGDLLLAETVRDLEWVADDRGLSRYKDLVGDNADACRNLTRGERTALNMAKQSIFATAGNPADVVRTYRLRTQQTDINNRPVSVPSGEAGPDY